LQDEGRLSYGANSPRRDETGGSAVRKYKHGEKEMAPAVLQEQECRLARASMKTSRPPTRVKSVRRVRAWSKVNYGKLTQEPWV
jgi:hypothetical protein